MLIGGTGEDGNSYRTFYCVTMRIFEMNKWDLIGKDQIQRIHGA